ncbi:SEC14-like protein 2 [Parasteatoda tepidariorum]|uniref:SEC14-like protein 2 n=1 Tax=Parasteatoda tepidariorum TaxID=114398 RepID=UPI00077FCB64|nr:SEC14-like protein 2 [Parasteatoda tepidariorum]XP_042901403.1 SEC14-like protein 2 [Parasteatoda tepidariorum]
MSGHVGNLSPAQDHALKQFKAALSDVLKPKHDDHLLLQFLRARRFDLKKAEEMFRRHLVFRQEFDEEYLVNEYIPPEILFKHLLPPLLGYDKGGSPIRIVKVGTTDVKGILSCFRRRDVRKLITWFLDTDKVEMRRRSKETGEWVETRTFIFDCNGLSLKQIYHREVYELFVSFLKLYEANYPENLKVAFVIHTPSFFSWVFNLVKSLLSEDTVQKLRIYGRSGWEKELLEYVDADVLPAIYGGKRTDPDGDPRCLSLIYQPGPIPKEYYLKNQNRLNAEDEDVKTVVVGRRSKHAVSLKVELQGSTIAWEVDCKNCDIHFSLLYKDTILESRKINNEYGVEKGCYLTTHTGNYSLVLDNSYSLFRSKTVLYKSFVFTHTAGNECPEQNGC